MGKDKKKKKRQENEQAEEQPQTKTEKQTEKEDPVEEKKPEEEDEQKLSPIVPKKVQYCPVCTLPFQLCKYGKKAKDCKKFLQEAAPTKVAKYHPDSQNTGETEKEEERKEEKQVAKKQKSIKEKYIVIDVKQRAKKKFVTQISGLDIFKIDSKDLTKKLSKKLACSCSATDSSTVQVQGDFYEDLRQMLIDEYKVKKKYILSGEEYKEKFKEEQEKKKEAKKQESKVIKEENEEEEKEQKEQQKQQKEQKPKYKTAMQQMLADVNDEDEEES